MAFVAREGAGVGGRRAGREIRESGSRHVNTREESVEDVIQIWATTSRNLQEISWHTYSSSVNTRGRNLEDAIQSWATIST